MILAGAAMAVSAEDLVILTTNDTHSNIDFDKDGRGGILPRKAIIDSVRRAEKNVILVDAGDRDRSISNSSAEMWNTRCST